MATAVVVVWSAVVVVGVRYPATQPAYFGVADISDWRSILHGQMFHHPGKGIGVSIYETRRRFDDGMRGYLRVLDGTPRPAATRSGSWSRSARSGSPDG